MAAAADHLRSDRVRAFNRFYTRQIGALDEHLLEGRFSLAETRVLYELAHRQGPTATDVGRDLGLDAGYLSRILRRFETRGLVTRTPSPADGRHSLLQLTARGRAAFSPLETRARRDAARMLARLSAPEQRQVIDAMATIERLLTAPGSRPRDAGPAYVLRTHQAGDMGWIVHRHGAIYAAEWRYDGRFEALVARICADFIDDFDPSGERCWIAERHGAIVGSVLVVRKSKTVAKLRLLLVEPEARGLGLGRRLVDECIRFAQRAGYRRLTLWTQSELDAARRIYQQAGFRRTKQQTHDSFGRKGLVAETWDLTL
jgi:DNA-binding MarR family transcriptional regulator/GNAT superfamily N-acetyltransferase